MLCTGRVAQDRLFRPDASGSDVNLLYNMSIYYSFTTDYYNLHASEFAARTFELDLSAVQNHFTSHLRPGMRILDFGCGSGRDSLYFLSQGFKVDAIDGSAEMCRIASDRTGIPVQQMLFEDFSASSQYDAIWACASLLHLPCNEIKRVLAALTEALRPNGILYTSFKYGTFEGERNGRYFVDMTPASFAQLLHEAEIPHLLQEEVWLTEDIRADRTEKWLNVILRRN